MIWKVHFFVKIAMIIMPTAALEDAVIAVIAMTKMKCTVSMENGIVVVVPLIVITAVKEYTIRVFINTGS